MAERGHGDSDTSAHQAAFAGVLHRLQVAGEASLALPSSLLPAETPQPQQGALYLLLHPHCSLFLPGNN